MEVLIPPCHSCPTEWYLEGKYWYLEGIRQEDLSMDQWLFLGEKFTFDFFTLFFIFFSIKKFFKK